MSTGRSPDVVVVGAGVVGAACAYHLAAAGVRVRLLDRSYVASGSSGACEGNVLAWDKELERELPLALRSRRRCGRALAEQLPDDFEYDRKGSVVVAETEAELAAVGRARARARRARRARARCSTPTRCGARSRTPRTTCPGGVLYPGDAQLEPRLATAALVRAAVARRRRARHRHRRRADRARQPTAARPASRPARAIVAAGAVVVAAGVWTPELLDDRRADRAGDAAQGPDRRARALAGRFRRKLSEAGYVAAVEADDAALQIAMVVESTPSGTALLGSSRQHVGFDREVEISVAGRDRRAAPRASSRSCTTPARCASTPGCGR